MESAREGDVVDIVARRLGHRALLAPPRHASVNEARVPFQADIRAEPETFHHARAEAFEDNIGLRDKVERSLHPELTEPRSIPAIPALRDDTLITATRKLNEALAELARAVGDNDGKNILDADRTNLAKFLTISRARMDNIVARLRSR